MSCIRSLCFVIPSAAGDLRLRFESLRRPDGRISATPGDTFRFSGGNGDLDERITLLIHLVRSAQTLSQAHVEK